VTSSISAVLKSLATLVDASASSRTSKWVLSSDAPSKRGKDHRTRIGRAQDSYIRWLLATRNPTPGEYRDQAAEGVTDKRRFGVE
jgi:hypothetical protein